MIRNSFRVNIFKLNAVSNENNPNLYASTQKLNFRYVLSLFKISSVYSL